MKNPLEIDPYKLLEDIQLAQKVTDRAKSYEGELGKDFVRARREIALGGIAMSTIERFAFSSYFPPSPESVNTIIERGKALEAQLSEHASEPILVVREYRRRNYYNNYTFGLLGENPVLGPDPDYGDRDITDVITLPTIRKTSSHYLDPSSRRDNDGFITLERKEFVDLELGLPDDIFIKPNEDERPPNSHTLVIVGTEPVRTWFTAGGELDEFENNCQRVGLQLAA